MKRRHFSVLVAALLGVGAAAAEQQELRILMIGNSYTAQTKAAVEAFLDADPAIDAELVVHSPGGKKLFEHAENEKVARLIGDNQGWDFVVLQDQSQLPAFAMAGPDDGPMRKQLDAGGPVLIRRIHEQQPEARVILFETWARHREPDKAGTLERFDGKPERMQKALGEGYRRMVKNRGEWDHSAYTTIAPVGTAWESWYGEEGYEDDKTCLHQPDRSHPGKLGAYLTGAVIYQAITGRPAEALGKKDGPMKFVGDPETAERLLRHVGPPPRR
jgi:hypothetical protein